MEYQVLLRDTLAKL